MKKFFISCAVFMLLCAATLPAQEQIPVFKHYDGNHLLNISLPVGGIGTGTIGIGGRGELRDFSIMNTLAIGLQTTGGYGRMKNQEPFFAINVRQEGKAPQTKALIGPLHASEYSAADGDGTPVNHHGLPRFSSASFNAAYPFGDVNLSDKTLPVTVRIRAFNPLVPCDAAASSIPVAVLKYGVTNHTDAPMEVSVCGTMRNFIGRNSTNRNPSKNTNEFRESANIKGIMMSTNGLAADDRAYGTVALATTESGDVSYRRSSASNSWNNALLDFWDDFSDDGTLTDKDMIVDDNPMASLAVKKTIAPGSVEVFTFYITWRFPNRMSWDGKTVVGNYYSTVYSDAWDVLEKETGRMPELERKTAGFVNTFLKSDFPDEVKEAALFSLTALRSETTIRIASGHLMGWEGAFNNQATHAGCGSTNHVWNYESATSFLYGDLARTMRDIEFNYALDSTGLMSFRALLPLSRAGEWKLAAADGQMGTVMRFYRDWLLSGDRKFLADHWEKVKRAVAFAWIKGGWDADADGVMEGCQHNTMDVEYLGPNPQMQFWYLGALRACEEMAKAMKDKPFEKKCRALFLNGSRWTDDNLFNGEYYIQKIVPSSKENIAAGLIRGTGTGDFSNPDLQLGEGCLVDQLAGQCTAHILGLGYLARPENIRSTYRSIMKYNYHENFEDWFNNMRSYAMGDDAGLVMASFPRGRQKKPFPYFAEVMTGFEYIAAVGMLCEGLTADGLKCIQSIRNRFDGEKRNPFDDPEFGHFYSRAMASWSSILALSGFHYSGVDRSMEFTSRPGTYFWSNGYAWGTCTVSESGDVQLSVLHGSVALDRFRLSDGREIKLKGLTLNEGETRELRINN